MLNQDGTILRYRGGLAGAFAPLLLFVAGVAWLALSGAPRETGFWPVLILAITVGLLLCRDRSAYAEAVVAGMSQPINMLMILAWLIAGMLAEVMKASGFVGALIWLAERAGLEGGGFVLASFLIACTVSFSTGTSLGTLILCTPLLYPAGGPLGAEPAMLIGAILAGATFGDNLSPVSDTTIASSVTQGAKIGAVFKSRLRYAIPAALLAAAIYFFAGAAAAPAAPAVPGAGAAAAGTLEPRSLLMALAPAMVIVLLLKNRHLLEGLLFGNLTAVLVALGLGLVAPSQMLHLDAGSYTARGLLIDGLQQSVGIAVFTLLLMGMVAALETAGHMQRLMALAERRIHSARAAEWWAFGTVSLATLLTTHSVVALLAVSRLVRETGARNGIGPNRRANLLDATVCTYPFLLPYCIPTILAASLTASGAAFSMPVVSALAAGLYNFHSWGLLALVLLAISTGWGRQREDEKPAAPAGQYPSSSAPEPIPFRFDPPPRELRRSEPRRETTECIDPGELETAAALAEAQRGKMFPAEAGDRGKANR